MLDKTLLRQRVAFVRQGSEVERWHTKRMIQRNDVGHHSFHVAWFAWLLCPAGFSFAQRYRVVMAALSHDLAEQTTGDVPGDFKRELQLREQFGQYEQAIFKEVGLDFWSSLDIAEERIVKFADMLEGAFFIISEASLGNARVGEIYRNYREYVNSFKPFSETEAEIVEYMDDLWANFGIVNTDTIVWVRTAHREESIKDKSIMGEESLSGVVAAEEAEGRATMPPVTKLRDGGEVAWGSERIYPRGADDQQSQPPIQGDAGVAEQLIDEPVDDRATSDLVVDRPGTPANARQHGGDHYKGVGYEHWDLVLDTGMNYFQGCATKYVTRWRKHEAGETNVLKAIHYVDKAQEAEAAGRLKRQNGTYSMTDIQDFAAANKLNELEKLIIQDIIAWRWDEARKHLERLRAGYSEPEQTNKRSYYSQND